jgi:hypothetical protein
VLKLLFHNFFFFCGTGVWTQGLPLETFHQPFFVIFFFQNRVLWTILPRLPSNCDPPDLCLLSSWDYRHESLAPGPIPLLMTIQSCLFVCLFIAVLGIKLQCSTTRLHPQPSISFCIVCLLSPMCKLFVYQVDWALWDYVSQMFYQLVNFFEGWFFCSGVAIHKNHIYFILFLN